MIPKSSEATKSNVGEGVVLDCRRQNFIKGGRAKVVLAISPFFLSLDQYSRAAFYYFFELRARSYILEMPFLEEDELNANFASSQRNCKNA